MSNMAMLPIAALTVMLWILWSDSIRSRKPSRLIYSARVFLYLTMAAVLVYNLVTYPAAFSGWATTISIIAALIGVAGAIYFVMRLRRPRSAVR